MCGRQYADSSSLRYGRNAAGLGIGEKPLQGLIVVSDTSAILNLAIVDGLQLLHDIFSEVIIPPSDNFPKLVDPGEAEAIVMAIEIGAGLILMDERGTWLRKFRHRSLMHNSLEFLFLSF